MDPETEGCAADAYTVQGVYITANGLTLGYLELRYSSGCDANWARITSDVGDYDAGTTFAASVVNCYGSDSYTVYASNWPTYTVIYTDMLNGSETVKATGSIVSDDGNGSNQTSCY